MPISEHLKILREKIGNELLQVPSVAAIIRDDGGKILLVKSAVSNDWSLPSGAIDPGEAPRDAIRREVWEETGLEISPEKIADVFSGEKFRYVYPNGDRVEYLVVVFECEIIGGNLFCNDGEISEFKYFSLEDFPTLAVPYPKNIFAKKS